MNIGDIEVADCKVVRTDIHDRLITIYFDNLFCVGTKEYVSNIKLVIKNWSLFLAKLSILDSPFSKSKEMIMANQEIQKFDLIQELIVSGNKLEMRGFSKDSGHWMIYEFTDYELE